MCSCSLKKTLSPILKGSDEGAYFGAYTPGGRGAISNLLTRTVGSKWPGPYRKAKGKKKWGQRQDQAEAAASCWVGTSWDHSE